MNSRHGMHSACEIWKSETFHLFKKCLERLYRRVAVGGLLAS
jgi:hypothetical protein